MLNPPRVRVPGVFASHRWFLEPLQLVRLFEPELVLPQAKRMDWVSGLKRVLANLREIPFVVLRFIIVLVLFSWFYRKFLISSVVFASQPTLDKISCLFWEVGKITAILGAAQLLIGIGHYLLKRRKWRQSVGMSLQDLREEHKENEGDPLLHAFRKAQHEEIVRQDLVTRIRASKVIVVDRK